MRSGTESWLFFSSHHFPPSCQVSNVCKLHTSLHTHALTSMNTTQHVMDRHHTMLTSFVCSPVLRSHRCPLFTHSSIFHCGRRLTGLSAWREADCTAGCGDWEWAVLTGAAAVGGGWRWTGDRTRWMFDWLNWILSNSPIQIIGTQMKFWPDSDE